MMMNSKKCLFAVGLLSLAFAVSCAKGGNGVPPVEPTVTVNPYNVAANEIYPGQTFTVQAQTTDPAYAAVTWSESGAGWTLVSTSPPNAASMIPAEAVYSAPVTVGSQATVTAALVSDPSITGPVTLTVADVFSEITPSTLTIGTTGGQNGNGLTQQFTAINTPDDAPQNFYWTCTASGVPCNDFTPSSPSVASAGPGIYTYTPADKCSGSCVLITAVSPLDPNACANNAQDCTVAKFSQVASRVNGTYAFQFSGFDNNNHAVALAGTFTANSSGTITSGFADLQNSSGPSQLSINGGSYVPTTADTKNSNNAGTLTLHPSGSYPYKFQVVLDSSGDIEMIEADGNGSGSGIAQKSASSSTFTGNQTFAFGLTGVDSIGSRVGYAGVLPMNGSGSITSGQMDANDNGNATSFCGTGPCSVSGTYTADQNISGLLWHMTVNAGTADLLDFDIFIASGSTSKSNPLTFYAISTNPVATHPAVVGTLVLQDSTQTYNVAALKGYSISALTGTVTATTTACTAPPCANVSLTYGYSDGNGAFSGQFDQNNAGVILSAVSFPGSSQTTSPYTYSASGTTGRYIFNLLGNPNAAINPLPFVLYASGQNRGFLLDQSSASVMTGTMNPQGKSGGDFVNSELQGVFAAATTASASSNVTPQVANLLITSPGSAAADAFSGTQYPGPESLTGTITFSASAGGIGVGAIALTAPSAATDSVYVLGSSGCSGSSPVCQITSFFVIDEDTSNPNPSVIFAQQ